MGHEILFAEAHNVKASRTVMECKVRNRVACL